MGFAISIQTKQAVKQFTLLGVGVKPREIPKCLNAPLVGVNAAKSRRDTQHQRVAIIDLWWHLVGQSGTPIWVLLSVSLVSWSAKCCCSLPA